MVVILNCRFTISITYQDSLHGFREGRGTWNATFEVKLLQQVKAMREAVLHAIFLDLHKVYNALEGSRCLTILEVYDFCSSCLRLIRRYWERIEMVDQAGWGVLLRTRLW